MGELVFIQSNDVFTTSLIVAKNLGYEHKSIVKHFRTYKKRFERHGTLATRSVESNGGRPTTIYLLNETQAVFLVTLLDNSEKVLDFKEELSAQFVSTKHLLLEKQTRDWQQTRELSKEVRLQETDAIKELVEYATIQGSKNAGKLYLVYSKLVKQMAGYGGRDQANVDVLTQVVAFESILRGVISEEMTLNTHYKTIYQRAKVQLLEMKRLWTIPRLSA